MVQGNQANPGTVFCFGERWVVCVPGCVGGKVNVAFPAKADEREPAHFGFWEIHLKGKILVKRNSRACASPKTYMVHHREG